MKEPQIGWTMLQPAGRFWWGCSSDCIEAFTPGSVTLPSYLPLTSKGKGGGGDLRQSLLTFPSSSPPPRLHPPLAGLRASNLPSGFHWSLAKLQRLHGPGVDPSVTLLGHMTTKPHEVWWRVGLGAAADSLHADSSAQAHQTSDNCYL